MINNFSIKDSRNALKLFLTLVSFLTLLSSHSKAIIFDNQLDKTVQPRILVHALPNPTTIAHQALSFVVAANKKITLPGDYDNPHNLDTIRQALLRNSKTLSVTGGIVETKTIKTHLKTFSAAELENTTALTQFFTQLLITLTPSGLSISE